MKLIALKQLDSGLFTGFKTRKLQRTFCSTEEAFDYLC